MTNEKLIQRCRDSGLRITRPLATLLDIMTEKSLPMTLNELNEHPTLANRCDPATVFRLIQRLIEKGIVRRLGLHSRAAYFTLIIPGEHHDYLICTECATIQSLEFPCPVQQLESHIHEHTGYRGLYHELEFFGICPDCSAERKNVPLNG